jgi:hypothetical protein
MRNLRPNSLTNFEEISNFLRFVHFLQIFRTLSTVGTGLVFHLLNGLLRLSPWATSRIASLQALAWSGCFGPAKGRVGAVLLPAVSFHAINASLPDSVRTPHTHLAHKATYKKTSRGSYESVSATGPVVNCGDYVFFMRKPL